MYDHCIVLAVAEMKFTVVYLCVLVLLATQMATTDCYRLGPTGKVAERRIRKLAEERSNVVWWRRDREECEKLWKLITVTACGINHVERVPTCEGQCKSEAQYVEVPKGSFQAIRNCRCCSVKDQSVKRVEKTYPGCPEPMAIPRDLTCECNTCSRDIGIPN